MQVQGHRIREARDAKGWSQSQLADRIGAHFTSISDWERGQYPPSSRHLISIARETEKPMEFFLNEDDEEAASMPLSGDQRDLLAALAHALEPFKKPVREEARA